MANRAVYISEEEVKVLADMSEVIEVVGKAMEQFSAGKEAGGVVQPVRTSVPVDKHKGYALSYTPGTLISSHPGPFAPFLLQFAVDNASLFPGV